MTIQCCDNVSKIFVATIRITYGYRSYYHTVQSLAWQLISRPMRANGANLMHYDCQLLEMCIKNVLLDSVHEIAYNAEL